MIKCCHYKYVLLSQIKVRKQSAGTKFFTSRFLNINRGEEVLYIEALDLKYKWEDVSQQSEHMGIDSLTNEAMIMQMNETMEILKSYISVQRLMILQIKDSMERLLEKVEKGQAPLIGKKDIMEIFNKESDFALRFLRVAKSMGFGIQVGREYYIKQKEFEKILNTYQGLKFEI